MAPASNWTLAMNVSGKPRTNWNQSSEWINKPSCSGHNGGSCCSSNLGPIFHHKQGYL